MEDGVEERERCGKKKRCGRKKKGGQGNSEAGGRASGRRQGRRGGARWGGSNTNKPELNLTNGVPTLPIHLPYGTFTLPNLSQAGGRTGTTSA